MSAHKCFCWIRQSHAKWFQYYFVAVALPMLFISISIHSSFSLSYCSLHFFVSLSTPPFLFYLLSFLSIFPSRLLSLVISLSLPLSSPFSCFSFFRPTESLSWRHLSSYSPWKKNVYRGRSLFVVVFTLFWFFKNLSYQQERQNDRLLKTNARQTSQSKTFYFAFCVFLNSVEPSTLNKEECQRHQKAGSRTSYSWLTIRFNWDPSEITICSFHLLSFQLQTVIRQYAWR